MALTVSTDTRLSCGIKQITGFGNSTAGSRRPDAQTIEDTKKILNAMDGYRKTIKTMQSTSRYNQDAGHYEYVMALENFPIPAFGWALVSLNGHQVKVWEKIVLDAGFVRYSAPVRNPNSRRNISLYIKERKTHKTRRKEATKST